MPTIQCSAVFDLLLFCVFLREIQFKNKIIEIGYCKKNSPRDHRSFCFHIVVIMFGKFASFISLLNDIISY